MKKAKRFLSVLLSLCLVLGMIPGTAFAADGSLPFTDVNITDWFYDAVQYAYEKGMMSGTSTTTFSPSSTTTRGMIVTILHRMEGTPAANGTDFTDVPAGQWYSNAVSWASANGIVSGYGNGKFGPNDPITREQMAAILNRYSAHKGYDAATVGSIASFSDASQVSSYAVEPMGWAIGNGLISGVGNNTLAPKGNATRAQVATILKRFCENIADKASGTVGKTYTVTFDLNYGSDTQYDAKTVKEGETVSKPSDPNRSGYSFSGWYTAASGGNKFDFEASITSDLTLYAHWKSNSIISPGGGGNSNESGSKPVSPSTPNDPKDSEIYSKPIDAGNVKTGTLEFEGETYEGDYIDNELVVVAKTGTDKKTIETQINSLGGKIVGEIPKIAYYQVEFSSPMTVAQLDKLADQLKAEANIEDAYVNSINYYQDNAYHPNDLTSRWQAEAPEVAYSNFWGTVLWGHTACMVPEAWDLVQKQNSSPSIRLGIIDSGFDLNHQDLHFISAYGHSVKYSVNDLAQKYPNLAEHGTHVAGIMGASQNNGKGIAGVAINAELIACSTLNDFFGLKQYASDFQIVEDIAILIEKNAKVINFSQGSHHLKINIRRAAAKAVDYLSKYITAGYDYLIVTSSGNNGAVKVGDTEKDNTNDNVNNNNLFCNINEDEIKSRIIVVGNVSKNNTSYERHSFSSYRGGRVDVMAPGTGIYSTRPNNRYGEDTGTSMASPFVAGLAGLVWEANPNLTPERVKEIICETATISVNDSYANMVNAEAAVAKALNICPEIDVQFSFRDKMEGGAPSCRHVSFTCLEYSALEDYNAGDGFNISTINDKIVDLIPVSFPENPKSNYSAATIKLPYGHYRFKISADKFDDITVSFAVSNRCSPVNINLVANSGEPIIGSTISGTVKDSVSNKALADVDIYVYDKKNSDPLLTSSTKSDGTFSVTLEENGTYCLKFNKEGYEEYELCDIVVTSGTAVVGTISLVPTSTSDDVIYISTPEQFDAIRNDLTAQYKLKNDIDMSGFTSWTPIGTTSSPFSGKVDGNGYSITGFTVNNSFELDPSEKERTNYYGLGLFGVVSDGGIIQNLQLKNVNITTDLGKLGCCGALVGKLFNGTIKNCHVSGSITMIGNGGYIGGLVGHANYESALIADCENHCNIVATCQLWNVWQMYAGGIVGYSGNHPDHSGIDRCYNDGNISVTIDWILSGSSGAVVQVGVGGITGLGNAKNSCNAATSLQIKNNSGVELAMSDCHRIGYYGGTNCVSYAGTLVNGSAVQSDSLTSPHGKDVATIQAVKDWYNGL